jgi:signal transduction histidine kinase
LDETYGHGDQIPYEHRVNDLIEVLRIDRARILGEYTRLLEDRGSRLARDPEAREQVIAHVDQILADVINSLVTRKVVVADDRMSSARRIGAARTACGIHPVESLDAAIEFFELVMSVASNASSADHDSPLSLMSLAVHQSLMTRIRNTATSYTGFLIDRIHQAHVDERKLLARELHDRVGSEASNAHRQLELYEMYCQTEPALADQYASAAREALARAMDEIRKLNTDLRMTEPAGDLEKVLRNYLDSVALDDVTTQIIVNGDERWIPPAVLDEIFLVIREGLRNSLAHANPRVIVAQADIAPHEVRATIDDDGVGFDPNADHGNSSGLLSMRERVTALDGIFMLSSSPGDGTHIEFIIPLRGTASAGLKFMSV